MLVGPFGIHVRREINPAVLEYRRPRNAGIQPHIQNVGFLSKLVAAAFAVVSFRHQFLHRVGEPKVRTFFHGTLFDKLKQLMVHLGLAAFFAIQNGHRRAPKALAGKTPIRAQANHGAHTLLSGGGIKFHVGQIIHQFLAQIVLVNAHKPLFGGAEDNRVVAAPAMRIAVRNFLFFNKRADFVQFLYHQRVGLKHVHALKNTRVLGIAALFVHGAEGL